MTGYDATRVELSDGTAIPSLTAVWSAGMQASPINRRVPAPRDSLGRLEADGRMRAIGLETVFAAGDTASAQVEPSGRRALEACQYAYQLGKYSGHNAASDLLGLPPAVFTPDPYVTCLDLGAAGAVYTEGFERTIRATGAAGKAIKREINRRAGLPAARRRGEILRRADRLTESRPPKPVRIKPAA